MRLRRTQDSVLCLLNLAAMTPRDNVPSVKPQSNPRMSDLFHTIGLLAKPVPAVTETLGRLADFLLARGHRVLLGQHTMALLPGGGLPELPPAELAAAADLLITVGGDGTLLAAARLLANHGIPLLGINLGRLGFLTDISPGEMTRRLAPMLAGDFDEEHRFLLRTEIRRHGDAVASELALNDAVIHKWNTGRLIEFETYVNGHFVDSQRSDGMIISTPTGSSAYALSGGGPLMVPGLDALLLVPICPHTLSNRPMVVGGDSVIDLVVCGATDPANVRVSCDGQPGLAIDLGDSIRIQRHPQYIRLIHPRGHDHFDVMRAKLGWGEHQVQD